MADSGKQRTVSREYQLPNGGKVKVTVTADNPEDLFILREDAAKGMAECLMNLADAMKP